MAEVFTYVLMVMVYGASNLAIDVEMQSFNTLEACNHAASIIENDTRNIETYCVKQ